MSLKQWLQSIRGSLNLGHRPRNRNRNVALRVQSSGYRISEQLESRVMLTSDPIITAGWNGAGSQDDFLPDEFVVWRDLDTVFVNINGQSVFSQSYGDTNSITLQGSSDDDTFKIWAENGLPDLIVNGEGGSDLVKTMGSKSVAVSGNLTINADVVEFRSEIETEAVSVQADTVRVLDNDSQTGGIKANGSVSIEASVQTVIGGDISSASRISVTSDWITVYADAEIRATSIDGVTEPSIDFKSNESANYYGVLDGGSGRISLEHNVDGSDLYWLWMDDNAVLTTTNSSTDAIGVLSNASGGSRPIHLAGEWTTGSAGAVTVSTGSPSSDTLSVGVSASDLEIHSGRVEITGENYFRLIEDGELSVASDLSIYAGDFRLQQGATLTTPSTLVIGGSDLASTFSIGVAGEGIAISDSELSQVSAEAIQFVGGLGADYFRVNSSTLHDLTLNGGLGADHFGISPNPAGSTISVDGNVPSTSPGDSLSVLVPDGQAASWFAGQVVFGGGYGAVNFDGIEFEAELSPFEAVKDSVVSAVVARFTDSTVPQNAAAFSATATWRPPNNGNDAVHSSAGLTINALGDGDYELVASHVYPLHGNLPVVFTVTRTNGEVLFSGLSQAHVLTAELNGTEGQVLSGIKLGSFEFDTSWDFSLGELYSRKGNSGDDGFGGGYDDITYESVDGQSRIIESSGYMFDGSTIFYPEGQDLYSTQFQDNDGDGVYVLMQSQDYGGSWSMASPEQRLQVTGTGDSKTLSLLNENDLTAIEDFTATIDWGDGHQSSAVLAVDAGDESGSLQTANIYGTHTYQQSGRILATITLNPGGGSESLDDTGLWSYGATWGEQVAINITSSADALQVSPSGDLLAVKGLPSTLSLATFTDPLGTNAVAADYRAIVTWRPANGDHEAVTADSSQTGSGVSILSNSDGSFKVVGSHTFTIQGDIETEISLSRLSDDIQVTEPTNIRVYSQPDIDINEGESLQSQQLAQFEYVSGWQFGNGKLFSKVDGFDGFGGGYDDITYESADGQSRIIESSGYMFDGSTIFYPEGQDLYSTQFQDNDGDGVYVLMQSQDYGGSWSMASPEQRLQVTGTGDSKTLSLVHEDDVVTLSDFSSMINWGDGSHSTAMLTETTVAGKSDLMLVTIFGDHTYSAAGDFVVTATVNPQGGSDSFDDDTTWNYGSNWNAYNVVAVQGSVELDLNGPASGLNFSASFREGDSPVRIASTLASITSGGFFHSATFKLTNLLDSGHEILTVSAGALTPYWTSTTGTLFLLGPGTAADYEAALRSIRYENSSPSPDETPRQIEVQVVGSLGSSNVAVSTIAVTGTESEQYIENNTGKTVGEGSQDNLIGRLQLLASDPDTPPWSLKYQVTSEPSRGALKLGGSPLSVGDSFYQEDINLFRLSYSHNGDDPDQLSQTADDEFAFEVNEWNDQAGTPSTGVFNFYVTPKNDQPQITTNSPLTVDYHSSGIVTAAHLNTIDPDDEPAELTYTITSFPNHGEIHLNGTALSAANPSFTQADIVVGNVRYHHDADHSLVDEFGFAVQDGLEDGTVAKSGIFAINVNERPPGDFEVFSDETNGTDTWTVLRHIDSTAGIDNVQVLIDGEGIVFESPYAAIQSLTLHGSEVDDRFHVRADLGLPNLLIHGGDGDDTIDNQSEPNPVSQRSASGDFLFDVERVAVEAPLSTSSLQVTADWMIVDNFLDVAGSVFIDSSSLHMLGTLKTQDDLQILSSYETNLRGKIESDGDVEILTDWMVQYGQINAGGSVDIKSATAAYYRGSVYSVGPIKLSHNVFHDEKYFLQMENTAELTTESNEEDAISVVGNWRLGSRWMSLAGTWTVGNDGGVIVSTGIPTSFPGLDPSSDPGIYIKDLQINAPGNGDVSIATESFLSVDEQLQMRGGGTLAISHEGQLVVEHPIVSSGNLTIDASSVDVYSQLSAANTLQINTPFLSLVASASEVQAGILELHGTDGEDRFFFNRESGEDLSGAYFSQWELDRIDVRDEIRVYGGDGGDSFYVDEDAYFSSDVKFFGEGGNDTFDVYPLYRRLRPTWGGANDLYVVGGSPDRPRGDHLYIENPSSTATGLELITPSSGVATTNIAYGKIFFEEIEFVPPTNDAPELAPYDAISEVTEDHLLITSMPWLVSDENVPDSVTVSAIEVSMSGNVTNEDDLPSEQDLMEMLTFSQPLVINRHRATGNVSWQFNAAPEQFDPLKSGEALTLTYKIQVEDTGQAPLTDVETISIVITGVDDPPVSSGNSVQAIEDQPFTFSQSDFLFEDPERDAPVSVKLGNLSMNEGTLLLSGVPVSRGQTISWSQIPDLTFHPNENRFGQNLAAFDYTVNTTTLGIQPGRMMIDVEAVVDPLLLVPHPIEAYVDQEGAFQLASFRDVDDSSDGLAQYNVTVVWREANNGHDAVASDSSDPNSGIEVSFDQQAGMYSVTAPHTWAIQGDRTVDIELTRVGESTSYSTDAPARIYSREDMGAYADLPFSQVPLMAFEFEGGWNFEEGEVFKPATDGGGGDEDGGNGNDGGGDGDSGDGDDVDGGTGLGGGLTGGGNSDGGFGGSLGFGAGGGNSGYDDGPDGGGSTNQTVFYDALHNETITFSTVLQTGGPTGGLTGGGATAFPHFDSSLIAENQRLVDLDQDGVYQLAAFEGYAPDVEWTVITGIEEARLQPVDTAGIAVTWDAGTTSWKTVTTQQTRSIEQLELLWLHADAVTTVEDFQAQIYWNQPHFGETSGGDDSANSLGTVVNSGLVAGHDWLFTATVFGGFTYNNVDDYTVRIDITSADSDDTSARKLDDEGRWLYGSTLSGFVKTKVTSQLVLTPVDSFDAVKGEDSSVVLATFTDSQNSSAQVSDFVATVVWRPENSGHPAVVSSTDDADVWIESIGSEEHPEFAVRGSHRYAIQGKVDTLVTVRHRPHVNSVTAATEAHVLSVPEFETTTALPFVDQALMTFEYPGGWYFPRGEAYSYSRTDDAYGQGDVAVYSSDADQTDGFTWALDGAGLTTPYESASNPWGSEYRPIVANAPASQRDYGLWEYDGFGFVDKTDEARIRVTDVDGDLSTFHDRTISYLHSSGFAVPSDYNVAVSWTGGEPSGAGLTVSRLGLSDNNGLYTAVVRGTYDWQQKGTFDVQINVSSSDGISAHDDSATWDYTNSWIGYDRVRVLGGPHIDLQPSSAGLNRGLTFTEGDDYVQPGELAVVQNFIDDSLTGLTVTLTSPVTDFPAPDGNLESLIFDDATSPLGFSWNPDSSVGTFSGTGTPADYQAAVRQLKYVNSSEDPDTRQRRFEFVLFDGVAESDPARAYVSVVAVNDEQVLAIRERLFVTEDASAVISSQHLLTTDVDNTPDELTYTITSLPQLGHIRRDGIQLALNSTFTQQDIDQNLVSYHHDGSEPGSTGAADAFQFSVNDGLGDETGATFRISIDNENDPPVISVNNMLTVAEYQQNAVITSASLKGSDVDNVSFQLMFVLTADPDHGTMQLDSPVHGVRTLTSNPQGTNETDRFTQADIDNGQVTYSHDGSEPNASSAIHDDQFTFQLQDLSGAGPAAQRFRINVTPVNDQPEIDTNAILEVDEGATAAIQTVHLEAIDPDDDPEDLTYTILSLNSNDPLPANGTLFLDGTPLTSTRNTFTQADIDNGLVTYGHDDSESTSDQFTFELADGGENGTVVRSGTFNIDVALLNDNPPVFDGGEILIPEFPATQNNDQFGELSATDIDDAGNYAWSITSDILGSDGVIYDFLNNSTDNLFDLVPTGDGKTADVRVLNAAALDYDNQPYFYTFDVTFEDGVHGHEQTAQVQVTLTNINEFDPVVLSASPSVEENSPVGTQVATLSASDGDRNTVFQNWTIVDSEVDGLFQINSATGEVTVADQDRLDYETLFPDFGTSIWIDVNVQDNGPDVFRTSATQRIEIDIINVVEPAEISVMLLPDEIDVPDNSGSVDFGTFVVGDAAPQFTFRVTNHGDESLEIGVPDGFVLPDGFEFSNPPNSNTVERFGPEDLTIVFNPSTPGTYSGEFSFSTNELDNADNVDGVYENPYNFTLTGILVDTTPEIVVAYAPGADELQVGGTHSFGSVQQTDFQSGISGGRREQTFYVTNTGTDVLTLDQIADNLDQGFVLVNGFNVDPFTQQQVLQIGESSSFTVAFDPDTYQGFVQEPTVLSTEVTFGNTDTDEDPFRLNLVASILPAGDVFYLDDDFDFQSQGVTENVKSKQGDWLGNTYRRLSGDGFGDWSAFGLETGIYRVSATWPDRAIQKSSGDQLGGNEQLTNATYTVFDGDPGSQSTSALANVQLNQFVSPTDRIDAGLAWDDLGTFFIDGGTSTNGEITVRLHSGEDLGIVMADGIRIERVDLAHDLVILPVGRASHRIDVVANDPAMLLNDYDQSYSAVNDWSIEVVTAPPAAAGTLTVETDNTVTFAPASPFTPSDTAFSYRLVSASLNFATRPMVVDINFADGLAILQDDFATTSHRKSVTFTPAANDFSPFGDQIQPVITSVANGRLENDTTNGWIDSSTGDVFASDTFYVERPDSSAQWSMTFLWDGFQRTANFTNNTWAHVQAQLNAMTGPTGTVRVYELHGDTHLRIHFEGEIATSLQDVEITGATIINRRGYLDYNADSSITYAPNPDYFALHGEYTELFRYTAGVHGSHAATTVISKSLQPSGVTIDVTNPAPVASGVEAVRVFYEIQIDGTGSELRPAEPLVYQIPVAATDADGDVLRIQLLHTEHSNRVPGGHVGLSDTLISSNGFPYKLDPVDESNIPNGGAAADQPLTATLTYRITDGHGFSEIQRTSIHAYADNAPTANDPRGPNSRFYRSEEEDHLTGPHFDLPDPELLGFGSAANSDYSFTTTARDTGFNDRSFQAFGDIAVDRASGTITTGQPLDLDLQPGASGAIGLQYSDKVANPQPVIQGSIERKAGASPITNLEVDLTWYQTKLHSENYASLERLEYPDPANPGSFLPLENIGNVVYSGTGDPATAETYHFAIQSPEFPDLARSVQPSTAGDLVPLHGYLRWRVQLTATFADGTVRPWTQFGQYYVAPRDFTNGDGDLTPAETGPFKGFGTGWTLSGVPYLQIFPVVGGRDLSGGYKEWADDRVTLVSSHGDAHLFKATGDFYLNEADGLDEWVPVSFDDRSRLLNEFGTLDRNSVTQEYIYERPDGIKHYFDENGLPVFIEPLAGPGTGFVYDSEFQLASIGYGQISTDPSTGQFVFTAEASLGQTNFTFDDAGWLQKVTLPSTGIEKREWDVVIADGNLTSLSMVSAISTDFQVNFEYSASRKLERITRGVAGDAVVTTVQYDTDGSLPVSITEGTGANAVVTGIETLAERLTTIPQDGSFLDPATFTATISEAAGLQRLSAALQPEDVTGQVKHDLAFDLDGRTTSLRTYFDDGTNQTDLSIDTLERTHVGDISRTTDIAGRVTSNRFDYENVNYVYGPSDFYSSLPVFDIPAAFGNVTHVYADYPQVFNRYDERGYLHWTEDALGRTSRFERDASKRITRAVGPLGYDESWNYGTYVDSDTGVLVLDVLLSSIDTRGLRTEYGYDPQRRVSRLTQQANDGTTPADLVSITSSNYDAFGNPQLITTATGADPDTLVSAQSSAFDTLGRLVSSSLVGADFGGELRREEISYYSSGLKDTVIDGEGNVSKFVYNDRGALEVSIAAFGTDIAQTTMRDYYPDGSVRTVLSPHLRPVEYFADPATRRTWTRKHGIATTFGNSTSMVSEVALDELGRVVTETNHLLGATTVYRYDRQDRVISTTLKDVALSDSDTNSLTSSYLYDAVGNLLSVDRPSLARVLTDFDGADRPHRTEVLTEGGAITSLQYSDAGDVLAAMERRLTPTTAGNFTVATFATELDYDEFGRMERQIDPGGDPTLARRTTTYSYSRLGLEESVTDRNGVTTVARYDAAGQLRTTENADTSGTEQDYDKNGNLISQTLWFDRDSPSTTDFRRAEYLYDELNRPIRAIQSGRSTISDPNGRVIHINSLIQETSYDVISDHMMEPGVFVTKTTDWVADSADLATAPRTSQSVDAVGNTIELVQPNPKAGAPSPVTRMDYTYGGGLSIAVTDPRGMRSVTNQNIAGWTLSATEPKSADSPVNGSIQQRNTFDTAGRVLEQKDIADQITTFTYDIKTGQVATTKTPDANARGSEAQTEFEYDSAGNRVRLTDPNDNTTTWEYEGLGRVTQETVRIGTTPVSRTWAYNGLETLVTDRDGRQVFTISDPVNRIVSERWFAPGDDPLADVPLDVLDSLFDPAGQLLSTLDKTGATGISDSELTFSYDGIGRQIQSTQQSRIGTQMSDEWTIDSTWYAAGPRKDATLTAAGDPLFTLAEYHDKIDSLNRVTRREQSVGIDANHAEDRYVEFDYLNDGSLDVRRLGQTVDGFDTLQLTTNHDYYDHGRLSDLIHTASNGSELIDYGFVYHPDLTLAQQTVRRGTAAPTATTSFLYDANRQLLPENTTPGESPFNENGLRTDGGRVVGTDNRLLEDGAFVYTYDNEGHRTRREAKPAELDIKLDDARVRTNSNGPGFEFESDSGNPTGWGATDRHWYRLNSADFGTSNQARGRAYFTDLAAGDYDIFVTWEAADDGGSGQVHRWRSGLNGLQSFNHTIDFSTAPVADDIDLNGTRWERLGTATVSGSTSGTRFLVVQLTPELAGIGQVDKRFFVDGVRIRRTTPVSDGSYTSRQILASSTNSEEFFKTDGTNGGAWTAEAWEREGDLFVAANSGTSQAVYTFYPMASGEYDFRASWEGGINRGAQYTVLDAGRVVGQFDVTQAEDALYGRDIGEITLSGGLVTVVVTSLPSQFATIGPMSFNRPSGPAVTDYVWDHRGRLTNVHERNTVDGNITKETAYTYDVLNRKLAQEDRVYTGAATYDVTSTRFDVMDGWHVMAEYVTVGTDSSRRHRFYGLGVDEFLGGTVIRAEDGPSAGSPYVISQFWNLADHQGSVTDMIGTMDVEASTAQVQLARWDYDAFGRILDGNQLTTDGTTLQSEYAGFYTGRELDDSTGLYDYRSRWFDPGTQMFVSQDGIGFAGGDTNLYRYANNSPTNATDPSGHVANWVVGAGVGAALGGGFYAVSTWVSGRDFSWTEFGIATASGAASGAVVGGTFGGSLLVQAAARGAASGAVGGAVYGGLSSYASGASAGSVAAQTAGGAIVGAIGGGAGGYVGARLLGSAAGAASATIWRQVGANAAEGAIDGLVAGGYDGYMQTGTVAGTLKGAAIGAAFGGIVGGGLTGAVGGAKAFHLTFEFYHTGFATGSLTGGLGEFGFQRRSTVGSTSKYTEGHDRVFAPRVEGNYVLFNKTHKASLPRPKGTGPNGGRLQSHHGLQHEWAKHNLAQNGYDDGLAPTITLETGRGFPHTALSNLQNARRNARVAAGRGKWSSTLQEELQYIADDFTAVGFSRNTIEEVLEQQYKMLDKLGVSYQRVSF